MSALSLAASLEEYLSGLGLPDLVSLQTLQSSVATEVARARLADGRELLLKRGRGRSTSGDGLLLKEGLAYLAYAESGVSGRFPRCILHDRRNDVLMLEFLQGGSVRTRWEQIVEDSAWWAELGVTLASVHYEPAYSPEWAARLLGDFRELIPSPAPLTVSELVELTAAQLKVFAALHLDRTAGRILDELPRSLPTVQIHGDLRLDNIQVDSQRSITFMDLGLSRMGDPLFDVGTVIGSMLELALLAGRGDSQKRVSAIITDALEGLASPVKGFIAGYRAGSRAYNGAMHAPEDFCSQASAYVGVHLLHRAGASAAFEFGESRQTRILTIAACSFLRNPSILLRPLGLDSSAKWLGIRRGVKQ